MDAVETAAVKEVLADLKIFLQAVVDKQLIVVVQNELAKLGQVGIVLSSLTAMVDAPLIAKLDALIQGM